MEILVDADACPVVIKQILFKAAERTKTRVTFIANQFIKTPPSKFVTSIRVASGFDVADNEIVKRVSDGDMVITADIPLADEVIAKGGEALSPRGELFTKDNIKSKLNMRDFMDTMRSTGVFDPSQQSKLGGQAPYSDKDKQAFANILNAWIR